MKIKEMNKEQRNEYYRIKHKIFRERHPGYNKEKTKAWRLNNPEKNKAARKRYKQSEKGKAANRLYTRNKWINHPEIMRVYARGRKNTQNPEYIKNYMKEYMKDKEKHRKFLIRQKDYKIRKEMLKQQDYCSICGSKENLEIHHKSYDESKNIIILCMPCHKRIHWKTK